MKTEDIEFKAKSVDGEWIYGCYVEYKVFGEELRQCIVDRRGNTINVDPATVREYIRKRDKNGIKIFEGDRVSMSVWDTTYYKRPFEQTFEGVICRGNDGEFYFSVSGQPERFKINESICVVV